MYRGRIQLGQELPLGIACRSATEVPTAPDAAPTFDIYSGSAKVLSAKMVPAMDRGPATGLFQYRQFMDVRFATGNYTIVYRYSIGSYKAVELDTFEVVAGGNVGGTPIAMYYFHKPEADFIIQDLDSGRLVAGRNPAV